MIIKNLNANKPPTCTACRKVIEYREKYFTLPSSFQKYCLNCAPAEVQKLIELLNKDLQALQQDHS
jgi:predicted RNA-binding Zn-ribbon protein involved in translation (DUF1610 family)